MSTSLLYHAFGIRVYQYVRTHYELGRTRFEIKLERDRWRCAVCGSMHVIGRGKEYRVLRTIPIGSRETLISLAIPRVECKACDAVRQVELGFADPRLHHTKAFERYAMELLRRSTVAHVAEHLHVGWDVIKEIHRRNLKKRFARPRLKDLEQIAIDEIHIGKGRYLTLVLDLATGAIVYVGHGRDGKALHRFWRRLRQSGAQVVAVAMDMSKAYVAAVTEYLAEAKIVFDRFHIVKLYNEKLSDLRRNLQREATAQQKKVLKGTRWLLLRNNESLDREGDDRRERQRLAAALELNEPLAKAYYLKEDLRLLWTMPSRDAAYLFLCDWIDMARASGVRMLDKFADTIEEHEEGILAWFDYPISTGRLEGTNNKVKTLKRQAYGYRDMDYFELRLLGLHETKRELVG